MKLIKIVVALSLVDSYSVYKLSDAEVVMVNINNYDKIRDGVTPHGDCTIVTFSEVTGKPYSEAKEILSLYGKPENRGPEWKQWNNCVKKELQGVTLKAYSFEGDHITINQFLKLHKNGTFIISTQGHTACIRDGVLYDHSLKLRRRIFNAMRIPEHKLNNNKENK